MSILSNPRFCTDSYKWDSAPSRDIMSHERAHLFLLCNPQWLCELRAYLTANYELLLERFAADMPEFPVMRMEGTYLAWVDCSVLKKSSEEIEQRLMRDNKGWVNAGSMYGKESEHFIRINMACPWERLDEGLRRIAQGLQ